MREDPTPWTIEDRSDAPPVPLEDLRAYVAGLNETGDYARFRMKDICGCLLHEYLEAKYVNHRLVCVDDNGVAKLHGQPIASLPNPLAGVVRFAIQQSGGDHPVEPDEMLVVLDHVRDGRLSDAAEFLVELMDDNDEYDDRDDDES